MTTTVANKNQRQVSFTGAFGAKRLSQPAQSSTHSNVEPRRSFVALLLKALSAVAV